MMFPEEVQVRIVRTGLRISAVAAILVASGLTAACTTDSSYGVHPYSSWQGPELGQGCNRWPAPSQC